MKQSRISLALLALFTGLAGRTLAAPPPTATPTVTETPSAGPSPLDLGSACGYAILAGSAITNSATGSSTVTGNVATYPTDTETGMAPGPDLTLNGTDYSSNAGVAQAAKADLTTAYNNALALSAVTISPVLGGTTEHAGVYNTGAGAANLTGTLVLDAQGNADAVFIFQVNTLNTSANSAVSLVNGATAANVFFVDSGSPTLGAPTALAGTLIAENSVTVGIGSTVNAILAIGGTVTFDTDTISSAVQCSAGTPTTTGTVGGTGTTTPTTTGTAGGTETATPTTTGTAGGTETATPTTTGTAGGTETATPTTTGTAGGTETATPTTTGTAGGTETATPSATGTAGGTGTVTTTPTVGAGADDPGSFLGSSAGFSILAATGITANGGASTAEGYVGSYPNASETGDLAGSCPAVTAATAQSAQSGALAAYNNAWGQSPTETISPLDLGGVTLSPGVYFSGSTLGLTGTLTLDGAGIYIIQVTSSLTTASSSDVVLTNGALASDVFWVVGSSAVLGTNSNFIGTIIANTSVTADTGATVTGRLLALNGAVTLDANAIVTPSGTSPCAVATTTSTVTPAVSGSVTQSPTMTETVGVSSSATPSQTNTGTRTPTETETVSASGSPTATPTATRTALTPLPSATTTPTVAPTAPPSTVTPITTQHAASRLTYFFPSPSRGNVGAVAYDMADGGSVNLRIYNQIGTLVDTITGTEGEGRQTTPVSVSKFAPGVYYYVLSRRYDSGAVENDAPKGFVVLH